MTHNLPFGFKTISLGLSISFQAKSPLIVPSECATSILLLPESVQYSLSVNQSYARPAGDTGKIYKRYRTMTQEILNRILFVYNIPNLYLDTNELWSIQGTVNDLLRFEETITVWLDPLRYARLTVSLSTSVQNIVLVLWSQSMATAYFTFSNGITCTKRNLSLINKRVFSIKINLECVIMTLFN